ncbi:hypothetical protein [Hoeflea marina]|uniref:hypothetical protein n=1 Tax=Hoeflea marina TaxID=274592 RepID=UPI0011B79C41|nr:hypothetical protein [Hoeflea marina]
MIEFLLLFAFGFLVAALIALIVAPVIRGRVVTLTERRMRASVPLSTAEIRAEKDLARAAFAAENARLSVDLRDNRARLSEQSANLVRVTNNLVAMRAAKEELDAALEQSGLESGQLRSELRDREAAIETLRSDLGAAIRLAGAREREIARLNDRLNQLGSDVEELKIDLATRETEIDNLQVTIQALHDERKLLRDELRAAISSEREAEIRLDNEEKRSTELEQRLARTQSTLSDRDQSLEQRQREVERLKSRQAELNDDLQQALGQLKAAGTGQRQPTVPAARPTAPAARPTATQPAVPVRGKGAESAAPPARAARSSDERVERLRARQAALVERLAKAGNGKNDAALRTELVEVAAMMVELTAQTEGETSPIRKILSSGGTRRPAGAPVSLAERARQLISAGK